MNKFPSTSYRSINSSLQKLFTTWRWTKFATWKRSNILESLCVVQILLRKKVVHKLPLILVHLHVVNLDVTFSSARPECLEASNHSLENVLDSIERHAARQPAANAKRGGPRSPPLRPPRRCRMMLAVFNHAFPFASTMRLRLVFQVWVVTAWASPGPRPSDTEWPSGLGCVWARPGRMDTNGNLFYSDATFFKKKFLFDDNLTKVNQSKI